MQTQGTGGISLSFVSLPDGASVAGQGVLDLGPVSYSRVSRSANVQLQALADRFIVSTKVGVAIQDATNHFASATLLASLASPDSAHVLRLDGVRLSRTPQVIQGRAPVGKTSGYRLEIEVPTSLTEKNAELHNAIVFQAVPN